jgi:uncharacterized membrane protein YsdA (DUF1294 family)
MKLLLALFGILSLVALVLYGVDKRRAIKGKWRISESVLLSVGFFGGSVGALLGMYFFRHKTRHWYFALGLPLMLLAHCGLAFLLLRG